MKLFHRKKFRICILVLALLVVVTALLWGAYKLFFDPYRFADYDTFYYGEPATLSLDTVLTREQAVEDMDFMMKCLRQRHPATADGIPENIQAQYEAEIAAFEDSVTVLQLYQASSRVFALMNDGHTRIDTVGMPLMYTEGAYFRWDQDNLVVYTNLLTGEEQAGRKVESIDGVAVDALYETFVTVNSSDMDSYTRRSFAYQLNQESVLLLLGIDTSDGVDVRLEGDNELLHLDIAEYQSGGSGEEVPFIYYEIDEENGLGILCVDSCDPNDEYIRTVNAFFTEVKEKQITNVALDLRYNGGGDSGVVDEFMRYMPLEIYDQGWWYHRYGPLLIREGSQTRKNEQYADLVYDGDLYVLTSVSTYSAATTFTSELKFNGLAQVVGEQSGNSQEYGELIPFSMPNSHLMLCVSNKQYFLGDRLGNAAYTVPDYPCASADALNMVYDLIKAK